MIDAYEEMYGKLPLQFQLESFEKSYFGDFICETKEDLINLPSDCEMGSVARVISPPSVYRKNSTGIWILQMVNREGGQL